MSQTPAAQRPPAARLLVFLVGLATVLLLVIAVFLFLQIFEQASRPEQPPEDTAPAPAELPGIALSPHLAALPTISASPESLSFPEQTLSPYGSPLEPVTGSISLLSPTASIRVINLRISSPDPGHGIAVETETCTKTESLPKATSCHISLQWSPTRPGRLKRTYLEMDIRPPAPLPGQPQDALSWPEFRHVIPLFAELHPAPDPVRLSIPGFRFANPVPGETLRVTHRLQVFNRPVRILLVRRDAPTLSMQQSFTLDTDCEGTLTPPPGPNPAWCEITALWKPEPGSPPLDASINIYYAEAATEDHPREGPRNLLSAAVTSPGSIPAATPAPSRTPASASWSQTAADFGTIPAGVPQRTKRLHLHVTGAPVRILKPPELFSQSPHLSAGLKLDWDPCLQPGVLDAGYNCPLYIEWTPASNIDATVILRWSPEREGASPQELTLPVTGTFLSTQPEPLAPPPGGHPAGTTRPQTTTSPDPRNPGRTGRAGPDRQTRPPAQPQDQPQFQPFSPTDAIPPETLPETPDRFVPNPRPPEPVETTPEEVISADDAVIIPEDLPASRLPQAPGPDSLQPVAALQPLPAPPAGLVELLSMQAARSDLLRRRAVPVLGGPGIVRVPETIPAAPEPRWTDPDYRHIGIRREPGQASRPVDLTTAILAGTPIPAVLDLHIDARQPTPVTATVERDVHASHGSAVIIPRGSRAIGYTVANAQQPGAPASASAYDTAFAGRIQIRWVRLIRPDGSAFAPASELRTADLMGRPGLPGRLNRRELASFLSALGSIALQAGTTAILAEDITRIVSAQGGAVGSADLIGTPGTVTSQPSTSETGPGTTHVATITAAQQARNQARLAIVEVLGSQFARALPPPPSVTATAGTRMNLIPAVDLWLTPAIPDPGFLAPADPGVPPREQDAPAILSTTVPAIPEQRDAASRQRPEAPSYRPYSLPPLSPDPDPYRHYPREGIQTPAVLPAPEDLLPAPQARLPAASPSLLPASPPSTLPSWRTPAHQ